MLRRVMMREGHALARAVGSIGLPVGAALLVVAIAGSSTPQRARNSAPDVTAEAAEQAVRSGVNTGRAVDKPTKPPPRADVAMPRPSDPLHVLLIVVDGLRSDMPWTGYERPIAPYLSALAEQSVTYSRAYAISSNTSRSVAGMLTGKYPSEMERNGYFFTRWYPENVFVSERVRDAGHQTLALHGHAYFTAGGSGMEQGFGDYRLLPSTRLNNNDRSNKTARRTTELAQTMLREAAAKLEGAARLFGYVHYMDPHAPYLPHYDRPSWGGRLRDLYDQEVHYTDQWVGELVDWARAQPWGDRLALIFTSDHGEGFGEHGQYKHGYELWEELIRVPLIISIPGAAARRIDEPRSQIDLAPTIMQLMGLEPGADLRGASLVKEAFGATAERRVIVADLPRDDLQDRRRAVVDGDLKLIAYGDGERFALFDLSTDPLERKNLAGHDTERFTRMKRLHAELSATIPTVEIRGHTELKGAPEYRRW